MCCQMHSTETRIMRFWQLLPLSQTSVHSSVSTLQNQTTSSSTDLHQCEIVGAMFSSCTIGSVQVYFDAPPQEWIKETESVSLNTCPFKTSLLFKIFCSNFSNSLISEDRRFIMFDRFEINRFSPQYCNQWTWRCALQENIVFHQK